MNRGMKMAKIQVIMDFDFDGFDELCEKEKIDAIETVLDAGAHSMHSYIEVEAVTFLIESEAN
jgi:hypothetical protein